MNFSSRRSLSARNSLSTISGFTFSGHVRFIDYEYTGYNYQAYDIGNHFNEFAGEWISFLPPPPAFPAFVEAGNVLFYLNFKYIIQYNTFLR